MLEYLPKDIKIRPLITEACYVIALRGREELLSEVYTALQDEFFNSEIEQHKIYSRKQINVYVKASIKSCFDIFMKDYPTIEVIKLKEPTTFLTHSSQLRPLKQGLENFLNRQKIAFRDPHTPVIANHCEALLTRKEDIRSAILALVDQMMLSATTATIAENSGADVIIELGLGNKSVQMLRDNEICTPVIPFTGEEDEAVVLLQVLEALNMIREGRDAMNVCMGIERWLRVVRENVELATMFTSQVANAIQPVAMLKLEVNGHIPVSIESIFKNSFRYNSFLQTGEWVLMARLKRNIQGTEKNKDQIYADLKILTKEGTIRFLKTPFLIHAEKRLFYFSSLDGLSNTEVFNGLHDLEIAPSYKEICHHIEAECNQGEPLRRLLQLRTESAQPEIQVLRRIIFQTLSFELMKIHRPGLFQIESMCLATHDFVGWLTCLIISGAASLENTVQLCRDYYSTLGRKVSPWAVVKKFANDLADAKLPLLSVNGIPIAARKDLEINTYKLLLGDFPGHHVQINLKCHLTVITLDTLLDVSSLETMPYQANILSITSVRDIWMSYPECTLEQHHLDALMQLTEEHRQISRYAAQRNLLSSTINAYIEADEIPVHFCNGGSESMTMLIQRSTQSPIVVRKILSEALTTAKWYTDGKGVMLPPFAKAARQVDYLRALPDSVKPWFPQVYDVIERDILTPVSQQRIGKPTCKEVIYEMSLVEGAEVSHFIYSHRLDPRIIARLYEIIFVFLRDNIHCEKRIAAPGNTLEISYFKKIEERLNLCRQTAPQTFGYDLIETEKIIINNTEYLNVRTLLNVFRSHPEYQRILEPRYHSLVMGDTNTENIKIGNTNPLLAIQTLINQHHSEAEISKALAEINPFNIQLRFLDPRAIGYQSEGAECRDDAMYDNKPWHNSIGHYDEIHNELFTLDMAVNNDKKPVINISFTKNNNYYQSYMVTDCAQKNINPLNDESIVGMEKYFSQVMNNVYDSLNPSSIYLQNDPYWLVRFVFMMGTDFTAMPPFHFSSELDGTIKDSICTQRRPVAIYCEGIKWLNWALEILQGKREQFLGVNVPVTENISKEVI